MAMNKLHNTIIVAAGGTGGHVYPAIAIADALKRKSPELAIRFIGTKTHMEWQSVPKAGYNISAIWISGFQRRFTLSNILFPLKLAVSLIQTLLLFNKYKVSAVICTGGYVSGPVGLVAGKKKLPLYVQEQNSFPGVTNRLIAKHAKRVFIAFKEAASYFSANENVQNYGNPVRNTLTNAPREEAIKSFGFSANRPTILIIGGSLGARSINQAMVKHVAELHDKLGLQIIWQTGEIYYEEMCKLVPHNTLENLRLMAYIDNMPAAYGAADVVISRAGASSLSEIQNLGKVSILVPSPNVAGNHQYFNAKSMSDAGAAVLLEDAKLTQDLTFTIKSVLDQPARMSSMIAEAKKLAKTDAADRIADEILADLAIQTTRIVA